MPAIDINCDMGESTHLWPYSIDKDILLLQYVSSVNLACGFHAGDAHTLHELAEVCLDKNIAIGAHPSFPDKEHFGRNNMTLSPVKLYDIIIYQLGALQAFLTIHNGTMHHVKPHGALYNMAAKDRVMADTICKAVQDFDKDLILYGLSGSELIHAAHDIGLKTCSEVFADRTYQDNGSLTSRSQPDALIEDTAVCVQQVLKMVKEGKVKSLSGKEITITAETVCIHGDGKHAESFAMHLFNALKENHIEIKPL